MVTQNIMVFDPGSVGFLMGTQNLSTGQRGNVGANVQLIETNDTEHERDGGDDDDRPTTRVHACCL